MVIFFLVEEKDGIRKLAVTVVQSCFLPIRLEHTSFGRQCVSQLFFFFSSRRRHTRCSRDWSSDVCRNLGPSVAGGRVAAVVGVPGDRNLYYVGAAAGGVWKTTDGGDSWEAVFKDQPTSSIGAVALAPSNPNVVWVGTGEGNPRNDVVDGRGVFMSPDAGKTWQFMGLGDVGQVSQIVIDPANPDIVFVAALGHVWAPNPERGVYRTADGGKTWQKVLFVNDSTGAAHLVMVPGNPRMLFAGMWQFVRRPWELVSGGAGSGVYRSKDGGLTWERLKQGLPSGLTGNIAVAVGPTNPSHIYALIETNEGMLWDSKDQGDHWTKVSDFNGLSTRTLYFSLMHVSPVDDRKLFFSSRSEEHTSELQ